MVSDHSAAGQALGYVFQLGRALIELLEPAAPDARLRLESIDDISWEDARDRPVEAIQVKHHLGSSPLSDMSPDVWRTIKVWLDDPRLCEAGGPGLRLVTTQDLPAYGALALLQEEGRDEGKALSLLDAAARGSTSTATARAREAWAELPDAGRLAVVRRIRVLAGQAPATELEAHIVKRFQVLLPVGQEALFVQQLLGWWSGISVSMLAGDRKWVTRLEVQIAVQDIRDRFGPLNLPVTVGEDGLPESIEADTDRMYVHQMRWVGASEGLLLLAIRDYYRAYSQMQDWVDRTLVGLAELEAYENRIVGEWKLQMEFLRVDLGVGASAEEMRAAGFQLLRRTLSQGPVAVRRDFVDGFYARGTYHRLADTTRIGWHPEFEQRVTNLLARSSV